MLSFYINFSPPDIDECNDHNYDKTKRHTYPVCDHICKNTYGGYYCECYEGYELGYDNRTCHGIIFKLLQSIYKTLLNN